MDLRWPPPKEDLTESKVLRDMLNQFETSTFEDLLILRYQNHELSKQSLNLYQEYRVNLQDRGMRMVDMFQKRLLDYYALPGNQVALDIGCGVGASSSYLAKGFQWVIGLDPSLPDLLLARKFFEEGNVKNVYLMQAYAQNIPLRGNCVEFVVAQNVIDHLFSVEVAFREVHRVLRGGGCFCGDSRNRFDLFMPEPHVKLRWVGFFPRKFQPWYVNKFRKRSYSSAKLLSLFELAKHATLVFNNSKVVFPLVSAYFDVSSSRWDRIIKLIEYIPVLRTAMLSIFPSHILLALKK